MKKGLSVVLSILLVFGLCGNKVQAFDDESTLKASYESVLSYYEDDVDTLYYLDEVIALGNAGADLSDFEVSGAYDATQNFKENVENGVLSVGNLAKHILACIFMGENPKDVNDTNLVELLISYVNEDGSVNGCYDANDLVWVVYALTALGYEDVEKVADVLASYQVTTDTTTDPDSMDNDKGGYGLYYVSLDSSAWVVEALSLVNKDKYKDSIALALDYMERKQMDQAGYKPNDTEWEGVIYPSSPNTDTQSSVVRALLVYDFNGVVNGAYDTANGEISDVVLAGQSEDGWFTYTSDYFSENAWSTYAALTMLSTYFEGSFVENANEMYMEMNTPDNDSSDDMITDGKGEQDIPSDSMENNSSSDETPKGPETKDTSGICGSLFLLLLSLGVIKKYSREYE